MQNIGPINIALRFDYFIYYRVKKCPFEAKKQKNHQDLHRTFVRMRECTSFHGNLDN